MSGTWEPVGDGVHEYQQETGPKPDDGTYTISVRSIGQSTKYPHVNFDYNPETGDISYHHSSFSKRSRGGMKEVVQTAVAYLKSEGIL
jgi:RimJ/RimL family protein N-acetyltransferase